MTETTIADIRKKATKVDYGVVSLLSGLSVHAYIFGIHVRTLDVENVIAGHPPMKAWREAVNAADREYGVSLRFVVPQIGKRKRSFTMLDRQRPFFRLHGFQFTKVRKREIEVKDLTLDKPLVRVLWVKGGHYRYELLCEKDSKEMLRVREFAALFDSTLEVMSPAQILHNTERYFLRHGAIPISGTQWVIAPDDVKVAAALAHAFDCLPMTRVLPTAFLFPLTNAEPHRQAIRAVLISYLSDSKVQAQFQRGFTDLRRPALFVRGAYEAFLRFGHYLTPDEKDFFARRIVKEVKTLASATTSRTRKGDQRIDAYAQDLKDVGIECTFRTQYIIEASLPNGERLFDLILRPDGMVEIEFLIDPPSCFDVWDRRCVLDRLFSVEEKQALARWAEELLFL